MAAHEGVAGDARAIKNEEPHATGQPFWFQDSASFYMYSTWDATSPVSDLEIGTVMVRDQPDLLVTLLKWDREIANREGRVGGHAATIEIWKDCLLAFNPCGS